MNVLLSLSLWLALILLSCSENAGSHEEEEEKPNAYDEYDTTPTPDYDYNATFDYYYVTAADGVMNNSEGEDTENERETFTAESPGSRADENPLVRANSCGSISDHKLIIKALLMSLPALFFGNHRV
ncbi:uncharacterized protein PAE49_005495 [Odontesthes bonariensis]